MVLEEIIDLITLLSGMKVLYDAVKIFLRQMPFQEKQKPHSLYALDREQETMRLCRKPIDR